MENAGACPLSSSSACTWPFAAPRARVPARGRPAPLGCAVCTWPSGVPLLWAVLCIWPLCMYHQTCIPYHACMHTHTFMYTSRVPAHGRPAQFGLCYVHVALWSSVASGCAVHMALMYVPTCIHTISYLHAYTHLHVYFACACARPTCPCVHVALWSSVALGCAVHMALIMHVPACMHTISYLHAYT